MKKIDISLYVQWFYMYILSFFICHCYEKDGSCYQASDGRKLVINTIK